MKTHRLMFVSMLMALSVTTYAQDTAAPPAAVDQTEMQKWIAATDAQWQAVFKRDVTDVHVTELEKLKQQYVTSLEAAVTKASAAGDLDGAVALRNEQKRFAGPNIFPNPDDADDAATVKQIRAVLRAQIAMLDKDTATRTKALHAKYDHVLAQGQTQLTQRQRLDDALLVKAKREEVAAAWIRLAVPAATEKTTPPAATPATYAQKPVTPPKVPVMAKVKAEEATLAPLSKGEEHTSLLPGSIVWESIPESLQGYQFTKAKAQGGSLRFKVLTDGLVYLACTTRFGHRFKEAISENQLMVKGWNKHGDLTLRDYSPQQVGRQIWNVYARECKAGEKFSFRNEQYLAPILLVK